MTQYNSLDFFMCMLGKTSHKLIASSRYIIAIKIPKRLETNENSNFYSNFN